MSTDFQFVRINGDFVWHAVVRHGEYVTRCGQRFTKKEFTEAWTRVDAAPSYQCLHCFPTERKP